MEMFFFLQKLSFSPLRTVLQDFILDLCTEQLSWHEFQLKLTERFPEYGAHFEKYRIASRPLRPPVPAQRLIYGDPNFPKQLTLMRDPPWTLTVSGSIQGFNRKTLSVVGSREPTEESIWWMETELQSLVDQGWVLASGGARGVDQKAHLLCLRKNRPTLVFLPSGINCLYPQNLSSWSQRIHESGSGFVSEFPDDYPMRKYSFVFRNRLIAALGCGLLVIQAGEKSGTLMTGHIALEMGRPVFAIPGHPAHRHYRGNLELIRLEATSVTSAQDLSAHIGSENLFTSLSCPYIGSQLI